MIPKHTILVLAAFFLLSSCNSLPASGPGGRSVSRHASTVAQKGPQTVASTFNYALVDISKPVATQLAAENKSYADAPWPKDQLLDDIRIDVDDTVQITIYESRSGGLFIPTEAGVRPGNYVSIPSQVVDKSGVIDIPFVGTINVVGRAPTDIGREIEKKLGARALEPQVIVSVTNRQGSAVSVIGAVSDAGRFPLSLNGDKVLDAVARAGGPSFPGHEIRVTLQRTGKEWTIPFDALILDPAKNVHLLPQDTVYLYREPYSFQVFGAFGSNGTHNFTKRSMTVAEALGEARGLVDAQADPAEIYLYRNEARKTLSDMNLRLKLPESAVKNAAKEGIPVIYRLNLRKPDGLFFAGTFPVRDKDIIYVANAESVEFTKFLNLLGSTSGTKITTQSAVEQR